MLRKLNGRLIVTGGFVVLMAFAVLFLTCDIGLGEMVNTEKPMISSPEDNNAAPGSYLQSDENGNSRIEFIVEQEFGLKEVYADVTYREKQPDGTIITKTERFLADWVPGTDIWYVDLPTGDWADGKFTVQVTAIDVSGNSNTPPELVYYVKNSAPQIELSIPRAQGRQFDDVRTNDSGDFYHNTDYLDNMADTQGILQGNSIVGMATDLKGIKVGYPQIMIWPAEEINPETNARFVIDGVSVYSRAYPNVTLDPVTKLPFTANSDGSFTALDSIWGHWNTVVNEEWLPVNNTEGDPESAVQFRWPMVKLLEGGKLPSREDAEVLAVGDYYIMFEIYDTMERENKNTFPNRVENPLFTPEENPRKYMTISVTSATNPIVRVEETPSYYNPNRTFVGAISIEIPSMSQLQAIYTRFSLRDRTSLIDEDEDVYPLAPENINLNYTNGRTITMDPARVQQHLVGNISGEKFWLIRIKTLNGDKADISRPIVFDSEPPYMNFIQPVGLNTGTKISGPQVTSTVTMRGSALDNQVVDKMYYSLGVRETAAVTEASRTSVTDNTGWTDTQLGRLCLDSCPANCTEHKPLDNHPNMNLTGSPAWFSIRASWGQDGILPAWMWEFADIYDFTQGTNPNSGTGNYYVEAHDVGINTWRLPIWFKLIDKAGNIKIEERLLILDPDRDSPITEISAPTNNAVVGGSVRVSGTANDNEWIHSMEVRVSKRNISTGALDSYVIGGSSDSTGSTGWVRISEHMGNDVAYSGNNIVGGQAISWFLNINKNGELTPQEGSGQQRILVEVRARDAYLLSTEDEKPNPGIVQQLTLFFDPGVPVIDLPRIIYTSYAEYNTNKNNPTWLNRNTKMYQMGIVPKIRDKVIFEYEIRDDGDLSSLKTRIAGDWSGELLSNTVANEDNPFVVRLTTGQINNRYLLYIPINTNEVNSGAYHIDNGLPNNFNFDIEAIDNAENKFSTRVNTAIQIDNFYPLGTITGRLTAVGDYEIQGKAWDTSQGNTRVYGIERVVVYLAKDDGSNGDHGTYLSLAGGNTGSGYIEPPLSPWVKRARSGSEPSGDTLSTVNNKGELAQLSHFPNVQQTDGTFITTNTGIIVSADTSGSKAESKTGGYNIGWNSGSFVTWSVTIDSKTIPDGKYVLHYVIFDQAGNATHNFEKIYVANNRPLITNIMLGTDSDYSTAVDSGEFLLHNISSSNNIYKESNPYFRVQNQRFELEINATGGNTQKYYRVYYVTKNQTKANALEAGKVYTIEKAGNIEWFNYGVPVWQNTKSNYEGYTFKATKNLPLTTHADVEIYGYSSSTTETLAEGTFSGNSAKAIRFGFPGSGNQTQNAFGNISGSGTLIQDTTGLSLVNGSIDWPRTPANARYFIIHVYDAAQSPNANTDTTRADQLSHVELINIGITNTDSMAPLLEVAPIGQSYELANESPSDRFPTLANYIDRVRTDLPATSAGYNQNIITDANGKRMGYVQYAGHKTAGATRPDVSGMVIFKGKAMDNNIVNKITATISNYNGGNGAGNEFNIATWNTTTNRLAAANANYTMANMKNGSNPWAFETQEENSSGEYGNVINWNFAWDTSLHSSVVASNATITFKVYDAAENVNSTTSPLAPVTIAFDIVPYISDVVTRLSNAFRSNPSAFSRSALGWYSIREGDTISVMGFNLGRTGTGVITPTATINSVTIPNGNITLVSKNQVDIRVDNNTTTTDTNTITSGALVLTTGPSGNTIQTLNNSNNKSAHYNQEPNGLNNNTLTDDRNLYVWRVGAFYTGGVTGVIATPASSTGRDFPYLNPVLRMDTRSNWYMSFGGAATNNGKIYGVKNGTAASVANNSNRWRHTTVAYDVKGNMYAIGADQTYNSTAWTFGYRVGMGDTSGTGGTWSTYSSTATNSVLAAAGGDRFQLPRIAVQSTREDNTPDTTNPTRILLSYFDTMADQTPPNQLRLHYGLVTGDSAATLNAAQIVANNSSTHHGSMFTAVSFLSTGRPVIAWYDRTNQNLVLSYGENINSSITVSSSQLATSTTTTSINYRTGTNITNATNVQLANNTRTFTVPDASIFANGDSITLYYNDVAQGSDLRVVWKGNGTGNTNNIALRSGSNTASTNLNDYFNTAPGTGDTIRIVLNNKTSPAAAPYSTTTTWQNNAKIVHSLAGSHVDMVIDGNDYVHLAYYDSLNGGLYYALIPPTGTGNNIVPNVVKDTQYVKVDTYLSAGTRIMLNVRQEGTRYVPYISYFHASFDETRFSVRVAWQKDVALKAGSDENDRLTGAWEVMTVPAENVPASGLYICNGVPTSGTIIGTYRVNTTSTTDTTSIFNGADIQKTMFVGYMTDINYEGAYLKHVLY